MGERLQEAREIGNVGAVYLAMGEFESALDCHMQHLRLARRLNNKVSCTTSVQHKALYRQRAANEIE